MENCLFIMELSILITSIDDEHKRERYDMVSLLLSWSIYSDHCVHMGRYHVHWTGFIFISCHKSIYPVLSHQIIAELTITDFPWLCGKCTVKYQNWNMVFRCALSTKRHNLEKAVNHTKLQDEIAEPYIEKPWQAFKSSTSLTYKESAI